MGATVSRGFVEDAWRHSVPPVLVECVRIPKKTSRFDPAWWEHRFRDQAVALVDAWCRSQLIEGMRVVILSLPSPGPHYAVRRFPASYWGPFSFTDTWPSNRRGLAAAPAVEFDDRAAAGI